MALLVDLLVPVTARPVVQDRVRRFYITKRWYLNRDGVVGASVVGVVAKFTLSGRISREDYTVFTTWYYRGI